MIVIMSLIILLFLIIIIFSFPKFSPIPYFPSNKKDKKMIIEALNLRNNQIIFDLGAGDGWVIFEAAKKAHEQRLNTRFVATEINPVLLFILYLRKLFHPNRQNIVISCQSMFNCNYSSLLTMYGQGNALSLLFYLYISPWYLEKTLDNIKKQLKKFDIVSYMYPIKSLKKFKVTLKGVNEVFIYNID